MKRLFLKVSYNDVKSLLNMTGKNKCKQTNMLTACKVFNLITTLITRKVPLLFKGRDRLLWITHCHMQR